MPIKHQQNTEAIRFPYLVILFRNVFFVLLSGAVDLDRIIKYC